MTGSLNDGSSQRHQADQQQQQQPMQVDDVMASSSLDKGATHRKLVAARRLAELGGRSSCHALGNEHRRQMALLSRSIARHGARHPLFAAGGGNPSGGTPGISARGADADMLRSVIKLMMCNDKGSSGGSSSRRRSSGGCSSSRRSSRSSGGSGDLLKSVIKLMVCQQDQRDDSCGSSGGGSREGDLLKSVIKIMMCGGGRSSGSRRSSRGGGGSEDMMVDVIRLFLCDSRPSGCGPKQILVKLIKLVFELYDCARGGSGSGSRRRGSSRRYSGSGSKRRSGSRRYSGSKKTSSGGAGGGSYAYDHASQVTSLPEESDGPAAISEADPEPEEEEPEAEPEPESEEE